jgi:hypothetical protein
VTARRALKTTGTFRPLQVVQSDIAACWAARGARPGRQLHPIGPSFRGQKTAHVFRLAEHSCREPMNAQAPEASQVSRDGADCGIRNARGVFLRGYGAYRYTSCLVLAQLSADEDETG